MANWTYTNGRLEARDENATLLCTLEAQPDQAVLADLLNANERLSDLLVTALAQTPTGRD